ncbi:MAG: glutamine--fructose-6-phosphate transaminase (isomerizing) [Clostridioides sp.]|jgi:glucosamine--fructose-6-phosphate aminotransferase (isomerizing)|nr:glutamine--fructose-6-phosphate transaminase (isomerizing) [Clostridioides sp.]
MCGIVGYLGNKNASEVILNGLSKLEYRGYDSAGIAVNTGSCLDIRKKSGRLAILADDVTKIKMDGTLGIGHTRWATHGEPTDVNAHPHFSENKEIAIVHNGIIENYLELKEELTHKYGVKFLTQTDSEVVAHLVDKFYKEEKDLLEAVKNTVKKLRGAFALLIIAKDRPDEIVAVRQDSPLVAGVAEGEVVFASDVSAILEYTRDIFYLDNGEIFYSKAGKNQIFDFDGNKIDKESVYVDLSLEAASKGGYDYFMEKEIYEQPRVIAETIERRLDENGDIKLDNIYISKEDLDNINKIYIIACGTAYHAGLLGKYAIEKLVKVPVIADIASEFRYSDPMIDKNTLVILVSQSGETADTLSVLREAEQKGARVLSITNVVGSSIARESHDVFYTWAGPEISVASTKAYTTQIVSLYMIALDFAIKKGTITKEYYRDMIDKLRGVSKKVEKVLDKKDEYREIAKKFIKSQSAFYIGRGVDSGLAMEGALKLKEISYVHAEAFSAGELKHGPIALLEEGTPVIAIATQSKLFEKMVSNIQEVKARGAYVVAIAQEGNDLVSKTANDVIFVPQEDDLIVPILAVVPMQLIAFYVSVLRGLDVDKPRNLAKSVTVE